MKSFANEGDGDSDVRVWRPVQVLERLAHNLFLGQWEVLDETLPWIFNVEEEKGWKGWCLWGWWLWGWWLQWLPSRWQKWSQAKERDCGWPDFVEPRPLFSLSRRWRKIYWVGNKYWDILMIPALKKHEMFSRWLMQWLSNYHLGSVCISSFASTSLMS